MIPTPTGPAGTLDLRTADAIVVLPGQEPFVATATGLSTDGCFLETPVPMLLGDEAHLTLEHEGDLFRIAAEVVVANPHRGHRITAFPTGAGLRFVEVPEDLLPRLAAAEGAATYFPAFG